MTHAHPGGAHPPVCPGRTGPLLVVMAGLLLVTALLAIGAGALSIPPGRIVAILLNDPFGLGGSAGVDEVVLRSVRLPRVLIVGLCGAALGVSGAVMQGLFRNPLADPGLIGVSAGAGLAASLIIVLGDRWVGPANLPFALLPVGAFLGATATTAVISRIATRSGRTSIAILLLAGVAIGALAASGTGFLVFLADDRQLRDMTFWMLGSFGGATWTKLLWVAPLLLGAVLAMLRLARPLDALALGEAEAWHMGVPVQRVKTLSILLTAISVGASVAVAGIVSFVGIVVPHLARLIVGPRHAGVLPAAALLGASLLLAADTLARTLAAPAELPLGVLLAAIGAPVFLHLLLSRRRLAA